MYTGFVHLHNFLRWVILLLLIVAIFRHFSGMTGKKAFTNGDRKTGTWLMIAANVQFVLGLIQWFVGDWGYIEKGIILYEQKQYDEALKVFNLTVTVSNTDADGYYWLGRTYEATGNIQDAIANYERAVALDRTFTEARAALRRLNS